MAIIDIAEAIRMIENNVTNDFASLPEGVEVSIELDHRPAALNHSPLPQARLLSECIALLPADSTATIDPDFAGDVEAAIAAHREPLEPPAWD